MKFSIRVVFGPAFKVLGLLAAFSMTGCGAEGEGPIKISNPAELRAKAGGGGIVKEKLSPKEAKAKAYEEEAAKKNAKLN